MSHSITSKRLVSFIKSLLKKNGYKYSDLAEVLDIKESSVKRIMAQGDFSVDRLELIADWFGFSFFEFVEKAKPKSTTYYEFSPQQDDLLCKYPQGLYVLILLSVGLSIQSIESKLGLDKKVFDTMITALDQHDLLRVETGGRVRLLKRAPYRHPPGGLFKKNTDRDS